LNLAGIFVGTK